MGVSSIGGSSGLDPFTPTQGPAPEESREKVSDNEAVEKAPLPEGAGTTIDTSA